MKIAVNADNTQQQEFLSKGIPPAVVVHWMQQGERIPEADAYFDLSDENGHTFFGTVTGKPVFINAVIRTCTELPPGTVRINAWNGFLARNPMEIAGEPAALETASVILQKLNWTYQVVPDTPGMIAARVIAMIINEAYFGLGDAISTRQEIDTAMKLGTNYPYGPFEWSEKIGLQNVHALLQKLAEKNPRYAVAPKLKEELSHY